MGTASSPGRGSRRLVRRTRSRVPRVPRAHTHSNRFRRTHRHRDPAPRPEDRRPDVPDRSLGAAAHRRQLELDRHVHTNGHRGIENLRQRALWANARWHGLRLRLLVRRRSRYPHHRRQHIDDVHGDVPAGSGHAASDRTDEPARNAISSSQINLTWTAATDNVGVTQYLIERCEGQNCTNFVQVATTAQTNYSDSGLLSRTRYRYRVRARDAANNLGPYSNIAAARTKN